MSRRLQSAFAFTILLATLSGCDSTSPLTPTPPPVSGPTSSPPPPPPVNGGGINIAGYVQDSAWRPLIAARVEVLDGSNAGMAAHVDGKGQFRLAGMFDETTRFRASAAGYQDVTLQLPARCPQCNPNWWIYFSLATVTPPVDLTGEYALTFHANPACTEIPEAFRSRTYSATVRPLDTGAASRFSMVLRGGSLLAGYDDVTIGVDGDYFAIPLGDDHGTPGVAEEVGPRTYLGFEGPVEGSLASLGTGTLRAAFAGEISYCELSGPPSAHFGCVWDPAVISRKTCASHRHEVVLQRVR